MNDAKESEPSVMGVLKEEVAGLDAPAEGKGKMLARIISGVQAAPRRVLLYGVHGVGKSTFAAHAPAPIFIQTEDGLGQINCQRFPLAGTFSQVVAALSELYSEKHSFQTVVIDSLDWLEQLILSDVCRQRGKASIEDFGYGKGFVFALTQWRQFLAKLTALRNERGMTVFLIAHAKIEHFQDPETDSYDRYAPDLHRLASAILTEWCDEVLFAGYKVYIRTTDEGFNRKVAKGRGTGERIIYTTERPAHVAKNRLNLPDELPLDWKSYASYCHVQERRDTEFADTTQVNQIRKALAGLNLTPEKLSRRLADYGATSIETLSRESAKLIIEKLIRKEKKNA